MAFCSFLTGAARRLPRAGVLPAEPALLSKSPAVGAPFFLTGAARWTPRAGVRAAEPAILSKSPVVGALSFFTGAARWIPRAGVRAAQPAILSKAPAVGAPSFLTGAARWTPRTGVRAAEPALLSKTQVGVSSAAKMAASRLQAPSRGLSTKPTKAPEKHGSGGHLRYFLVVCAIGGVVTVYCYCMSEKTQYVDIDEDVVLPDYVDWSVAPAFADMVHPSYNFHCGSCWAVVAVKSIEADYAIKNGVVVNLSVQQVIDSAAIEGCKGSNLVKAYRYIKIAGLTTEKAYPGPPSPGRSVLHGLLRGYCQMEGKPVAVRIEGYQRVRATEDHLMRALQSSPVAVYVNVNDRFRQYRGGYLDIDDCPPRSEKPAGRHVLLVVGYGTDSDGTKYWKVMNTWGSWWGVGGYGKFIRGGHPHGVAGITEFNGFRPVLSKSCCK